jgi:hypothetical protein
MVTAYAVVVLEVDDFWLDEVCFFQRYGGGSANGRDLTFVIGIAS